MPEPLLVTGGSPKIIDVLQEIPIAQNDLDLFPSDHSEQIRFLTILKDRYPERAATLQTLANSLQEAEAATQTTAQANRRYGQTFVLKSASAAVAGNYEARAQHILEKMHESQDRDHKFHGGPKPITTEATKRSAFFCHQNSCRDSSHWNGGTIGRV